MPEATKTYCTSPDQTRKSPAVVGEAKNETYLIINLAPRVTDPDALTTR